jgi:hypothetical protein
MVGPRRIGCMGGARAMECMGSGDPADHFGEVVLFESMVVCVMRCLGEGDLFDNLGSSYYNEPILRMS